MIFLQDLSSIVSDIIPSGEAFKSFSGTAILWLSAFILLVIIFVLGAIGVYYLIRILQFNNKITIYEDRNGIIEYFGKDRAKEITYNIYGDSIFYLRKRKKYLPRPERKIGKRRYLYFIGADGEWVNVGLESFDRAMKEMKIKPIHPDMRAMKSGMAKLVKDRYEKKENWFSRNAHVIIPLIFFVITAIALYFIVDRIVASQNNVLEVIQSADAVMDKANQVLSSLNNICSGSGIQ